MNKLTILDNFKSYIARHALFTMEDKILLTVSGGVDSMVMLSLFVQAGYNIGVAHCNFQLRGQESDEDEVMVMELTKKLGVPLHNKRFNTMEEVERSGDSVEMVARRQRYEWFYSLCETEGYKVISVAHHVDDSIETFFINLLRGTGLRGLTGINHQMGKVVRPLMFASRKEILEYAIQNKIPYREDSTNHTTKYLRNKIRLGIIPLIKEIKPAFSTLMRGNLYHLMDAQRFVDVAINKIKKDIVEHDSSTGIDTIFLSRIDREFPVEFIIYQVLNSEYNFKGDVIDDMCKSIINNQTGKRFYSREYVAYYDRETIKVGRIEEEDDCQNEILEETFKTYCGNSILHFENTDIDNIATFNVPQNIALLDKNLLKYPLILRRWHEGDSFVPFGMEGKKKVGDYLTDKKMSLLERSRQFVLLSGDDIVWLVGQRIDDRYKISSSTEEILKITREFF